MKGIQPSRFNFLVKLSGALVLFLVLIFGLAGRLDYWQAWIFAGVNLLLILTIVFIFTDLPGLVQDRMKMGQNTKWWDKIFWMIYGPMNLVIVILACLDAGRYFWTGSLPVYVYLTGYLIYISANFIHLWAIRSNPFYSSTVRIQEEKGQIAVQDGPYRFIRHPGYVGVGLMIASLGVVLGSLYVLLPAGFVWILLLIRTYLEDETLKKELPGYTDYCGKVHYRLIPGIW